MSRSSMSKTSIPCGRSGLPSYASFAGIQKRRFSPSTMSDSPSLQPWMTLSSGRTMGLPRATEESNIMPSVVQPV